LDVERIVALTALLTFLNGIVAFFVLFRQEPILRPSIPLACESLRYGLVIYIGFLANVLHFKIDQVMINYWLGTDAVGIYVVSVRWAEMLFILDNPIISASLSKISSLPPHESYDLTNRLFKIQLLISGGAGILLVMAAYPLVIGLYGEAYRGAVWPLILLVPGMVAWSVSKIVSGALTYKSNRALYVTKVAICGFFVNLFLNYILIKVLRMGISGASLASSFTYLFVALCIQLKARNILKQINITD
jgi:O-antigen/teichoic acid export membrane protein